MKVNVLPLLLCAFIVVTLGCDQAATEPQSESHEAIHGIVESADPSEIEPLNFERFIGERKILQGTYSNKLKEVHLELTFPDKHELLPKAKPEFVLYDEQGRPLFRQLIHQDHSRFMIDHPVRSSKAFLKVGVYYCKQGAEGLCMMQNVLYQIFLSETGKDNIVDLKFELPPSHF